MAHGTPLDSCLISQISHPFVFHYLHFFFAVPELKCLGVLGDRAGLVSKADTLDHPHKSGVLGKARAVSRDRSDPGIMLTQLLVMDFQHMGSEISPNTQFLSLETPSNCSTGLNPCHCG